MIGRRTATEVQAWMQSRLTEECSPGDLASHAGLTPRSLQRAFLRYFHATPSNYVKGLRLDAAREALISRPGTDFSLGGRPRAPLPSPRPLRRGLPSTLRRIPLGNPRSSEEEPLNVPSNVLHFPPPPVYPGISQATKPTTLTFDCPQNRSAFLSSRSAAKRSTQLPPLSHENTSNPITSVSCSP